jgi:hypothetical protein
MLSGQLSFSKMAQLLERIIFAGTTRDNAALPAIPDFLYPVAGPARDNNEVNHVYLPWELQYAEGPAKYPAA